MNPPGLSSAGNPVPDPVVDHLLQGFKAAFRDVTPKAYILLERYQEAGTKYHSLPLVARFSEHIPAATVTVLAHTYTTTAGREETSWFSAIFGDLYYCLVEATHAIEGEEQDLKAACRFVSDAGDLLTYLTECMDAIETAVADVVEIRDSLMEQGLLLGSHVWMERQQECFREWVEAQVGWDHEVVEENA